MMLALTVKQPWTDCFFLEKDPKRGENRTWPPYKWAIGQRIALHSSGTFSTMQEREAANMLAGFDLMADRSRVLRGHVLGTGLLKGFCHYEERNFRWVPYGMIGDYNPDEDKWAFGPFVWLFDEVEKLDKPIPAKGQRGIWEFVWPRTISTMA